MSRLPAQAVEPLELAIFELPSIDSSTSAQPLATSVACAVTNSTCEWVRYSGGFRVFLPGEKHRDAYRKKIRASGTGTAYRQLIERKADLVFVARRPAAEERALASKQGFDLNARPIARDALVFIVEAANPIEDLSLASIRGIYAGEVRSWAELGGNRQSIQAFGRNSLSGSYQLMRELGIEDRSQTILMGMKDPLLEVAARPNAIAYTVFYFDEHMAAKDSRKRIAVDGVAPSEETIRDGTYPLATEVYAVIRSDLDESHVARRIVGWLATEEGRGAVEAVGYVSY